MHQSASQAGQKVIDISMVGNKIWKKVLAIIAILSLIAVMFHALWYKGAFLPQWITWEQKVLYDQFSQYEITLKNKKVRITYDSTDIWSTSGDVKVQDMVLFDMDGDSKEELILLCWKKGRYGKHKPFWVEKDEQNWSQHVFVYEFQGDIIKPKWMSSYIGLDVKELSTDNKFSKKFLLFTDLDGETSYWTWDSWGFTRWTQEFH